MSDPDSECASIEADSLASLSDEELRHGPYLAGDAHEEEDFDGDDDDVAEAQKNTPAKCPAADQESPQPKPPAEKTADEEKLFGQLVAGLLAERRPIDNYAKLKIGYLKRFKNMKPKEIETWLATAGYRSVQNIQIHTYVEDLEELYELARDNPTGQRK